MTKKIMIVEDELLIAETLKYYVEEGGHSVIGIAISFQEAVHLLSKEIPDILLLDLRLYGEKSGLDIVKYLYEKGKTIPYVIISSMYNAQDFNDCIFNNALAIITKPVSKPAIMKVIASVV